MGLVHRNTTKALDSSDHISYRAELNKSTKTPAARRPRAGSVVHTWHTFTSRGHDLKLPSHTPVCRKHLLHRCVHYPNATTSPGCQTSSLCRCAGVSQWRSCSIPGDQPRRRRRRRRRRTTPCRRARRRRTPPSPWRRDAWTLPAPARTSEQRVMHMRW